MIYDLISIFVLLIIDQRDITFDKQSVIKDLVGATRLAVEEALLSEHQSASKVYNGTQLEERERMMGAVASGLYKNPLVNSENTRMQLQHEFGSPTSYVSKTGKHVQYSRGQKNGMKHFRNNLKSSFDSQEVVFVGDGDDDEITVVNNIPVNKAVTPMISRITNDDATTRVRNKIYKMCRSEKNDGKKKKIKEATKSLVSKGTMAMNIIEVERSKYELTPEKVFLKTLFVVFLTSVTIVSLVPT